MNENFCNLIKISRKFFPAGPIGNKSALVEIMTLCQTSDKPLPEAILINILYDITSSQCVNCPAFFPNDP